MTVHLISRREPNADGWALTACTETTTRWTRRKGLVTCRRCLATHLYREP